MCNWRTKEAKFECLKCNGRVFLRPDPGRATQMASPASFHSNPDDGSCKESVLKRLDKMLEYAQTSRNPSDSSWTNRRTVPSSTSPSPLKTASTLPPLIQRLQKVGIHAQSRNKKGKKFLKKHPNISRALIALRSFLNSGLPFVNCLCQKPVVS